jgi:hypothetical protein
MGNSGLKKDVVVNSSVEFVRDIRLYARRPGTYRARLAIRRQPPPHAAAEGKLTWTLKATVELADGKSASETQKVAVTIP